MDGKQEPEERSRGNQSPVPNTGMPRWVKVSLWLLAAAILIFVLVGIFTPGGHGPGMHSMPAGSAGPVQTLILGKL